MLEEQLKIRILKIRPRKYFVNMDKLILKLRK